MEKQDLQAGVFISNSWCLPKQTTCEMKAFEIKVYIQQWFDDKQGAKFM